MQSFFASFGTKASRKDGAGSKHAPSTNSSSSSISSSEGKTREKSGANETEEPAPTSGDLDNYLRKLVQRVRVDGPYANVADMIFQTQSLLLDELPIRSSSASCKSPTDSCYNFDWDNGRAAGETLTVSFPKKEAFSGLGLRFFTERRGGSAVLVVKELAVGKLGGFCRVRVGADGSSWSAR